MVCFTRNAFRMPLFLLAILAVILPENSRAALLQKPPKHSQKRSVHNPSKPVAAPPDITITGEQFWFRAWATPPRIPMAGDANGDGHADLLSFWPQGDGVIEVAITSKFGKSLPHNQARTGFSKDGLAGACGAFSYPGKGADVLGIFSDGSIHVATDMLGASHSYGRDTVAGKVPPEMLPHLPTKCAVADFDGDGKLDVLIADKDGRLLMLWNRQEQEGTAKFQPIGVTGIIAGWRQFYAGTFQAGKPAEIVWLDSQGKLQRAPLSWKQNHITLGISKTLLTVQPETHLVTGRFHGGVISDILVGQNLLIGGDPAHSVKLPTIPDYEQAKGDAPWIAADFDGNGRDDLLRLRRTSAPFLGEDTYIHFSVAKKDPYPGYYCSANDGLLDAWKLGKITPAGLDLPALGCKVGRAEIIVEIERFENIDLEPLKKSLEEDARYFASLPTPNPDHSTGITLIPVFKPPYPLTEHNRLMGDFDGNFPPVDRRGVVHTMFAEKDGPLVAKVCGDNGHFNGGKTEFLHEFGHQLNLSHTGWHDVQFSPVFHSTMNYSYGYIDDPFTKTSLFYSDGRLAGLTFNEQHLSEYIPLPMEKVQFMAGPPYNFRIKPSPDNKGTLIDWNWNGIFGETDVQADINYSHGVNIWGRYDIGRAQSGPVLVLQGSGDTSRLLMVYGQAAAGHIISENYDGKLMLRWWQGKNRESEATKWSPEQAIVEKDVTGEPSAASLQDTTWIAYPKPEGVILQRIQFDAGGKLQIGKPNLMTGTRRADPTLVWVGGKLVLLLWRGQKRPITAMLLDPKSDEVKTGEEIPLGLMSAIPAAAVAGAEDARGASLWISRTVPDGEAPAEKTELHRFVLDKSGELHDVSHEWVDGIYARHRMTLIWTPEKGLKGQGRIYLLSGGRTTAKKIWSEQYITQNVAYKEIGNGWQVRKYFSDDNAPSISAPGACLFQGNIVYALRLYDQNPDRNDVISLSFYGSGVTPETKGDFDDIHHLRDFGLSRSLAFVYR